MKQEDDDFAVAVGRRLRAVAWEFGFETQAAFAAYLGDGVTTGQVETWYNGRALPPIRKIRKIAEHGVTMDWLYCGKPDAMAIGLYGRLIGWLTAETPEQLPSRHAPSPAAPSPAGKRPAAPGKQRQRFSAVVKRRDANRASAA